MRRLLCPATKLTCFQFTIQITLGILRFSNDTSFTADVEESDEDGELFSFSPQPHVHKYNNRVTKHLILFIP